MYYCFECNRKFSKSVKIYERHVLNSPPFEGRCVCPFCKSSDYEEISQPHFTKKKIKDNRLYYDLASEAKEYNLKHNESLSLGEYAVIIKPRLLK